MTVITVVMLLLGLFGCASVAPVVPAPPRVAYLGSSSTMTPKALEALGYAGYIVTGDPAQFRLVLHGHRYEYFDEPEYHPDLYREWYATHKDLPRFEAYHEIMLAKERGVYHQPIIAGFVWYPDAVRGPIDAILRMGKMRHKVRQFLRDYPQGPVIGIIQTFDDGAGFPSVDNIRWQEWIWIEEAGDRLIAIAHFIFDTGRGGVFDGRELKNHPEAWPDKL